MSLVDSFREFFSLGPLHERAIDSFVDHPGLTEQLLAVQGLTARPWRAAGIREALGVPAIHRAVTLISKTGASLSLEVFRDGVRVDPDDRPRIVVRPDPLSSTHDFVRDSIYSMATRGELWWWIARRDSEDRPLSLRLIPAQEVSVTEDPRDLRYPIIEWRGKRMPNDDMVQVTLMREPGSLRGFGPLQMCGAAVSVAVESQEWAANFFAAGGYPNIWIKAAGDLSGDPRDGYDPDGYSEIQRLKAQWIETTPNTPKVTDEGIVDIKQFDPNPQGAQMLDARDHQNGDVARMFGIPGSMLDYRAGGSNLTYQNLEQEKQKFIDLCLSPYYLEPIEQAMSDLLTRSHIARFNRFAFLQADIKTRFEVYQLGIGSGVIDVEEARRMEGMERGDVEVAPVPLNPAIPPAVLPFQSRTAEPVRCDGRRNRLRHGVTVLAPCNNLLAERGPFVGTCRKCKKKYEAA